MRIAKPLAGNIIDLNEFAQCSVGVDCNNKNRITAAIKQQTVALLAFTQYFVGFLTFGYVDNGSNITGHLTVRIL